MHRSIALSTEHVLYCSNNAAQGGNHRRLGRERCRQRGRRWRCCCLSGCVYRQSCTGGARVCTNCIVTSETNPCAAHMLACTHARFKDVLIRARTCAHTHTHTRTNMHTHARTPRMHARAHVWARVHRCCRHGEKNIAVTEYLSECSVPCTRCTGQAGGLVSGRSAKLPPGKIETTRVKDANHVARRWAQGNVSVLLPGTGVTAWGTYGCASERQEWRDARAPPCRACMPLEWLFDGWSQGQQNLSGADHRRASEPSLQIVSPTNAKLASD